MPLFEYKCSECNTKFEILHKSAATQNDVTCPSCNSLNNKKLLSTFSANVPGSPSASYGSCDTGNCDIPSAGGCSTGMCGLN
jgi:putative FmdB family regulatory protein